MVIFHSYVSLPEGNTTTLIFKNTVPIILNVAPTCSCADQTAAPPSASERDRQTAMLQHKMGKPWPWILNPNIYGKLWKFQTLFWFSIYWKIMDYEIYGNSMDTDFIESINLPSNPYRST